MAERHLPFPPRPTNIMQPHDTASRCCAYNRQTTGVNQTFQPQNNNVGYTRERYGSRCSYKRIGIPTLINDRSTPPRLRAGAGSSKATADLIESLLPVSCNTRRNYNNGQSPLSLFLSCISFFATTFVPGHASHRTSGV